ncbi:isopeptide-forming domain-containing fimbrial protein [Bacillus mojavensis]|uniref:isopeptide-forming domain-containing fimbrial protein n=1 Tax=Bacillus mojavensis TaxID=72360 RepID=UPI002DBACE14|nr:isopeptide-forming domain-containing fimbrial protein [Bacillus mojavensis]MEC1679417.1 isopeptide-forming domain-containing fimbrial protein [Bacillus mojavensis]MEC1711395.1 isopeptide-forming domain-containing fimbrial protein [Bacillus mojavensis]
MLVTGNLLTALPNHMHAEDNTEVTENADTTCSAPVALINGSFEQGAARGSAHDGSGLYYLESEVPGWKTTDKAIEIWNYKENIPAVAKNWPAPPNGNRWAELNAFENGMLYQDVKTTPGQTIYWRLSHMGRNGVDTMQVRIGEVTATPYDTKVQKQLSDGRTAWGTHTGSYTVPAGQTKTRFGFEAVSTAGGSIGAGNFLDDIFLGTEPCVTANKSVSPQGEVHPGDELTYTVQVKNQGGDVAADASFTDAIPEGTEYVPGTLKLINGSTTKNLTDASDGDAGYFDGSKVNITLGDLPNTNNLPNGMTVQLKVKAKTGYAGKEISNKAQINYDSLLTNTSKQTESNEVTTPVVFKDPVLESKKTSTIKSKAEGNQDADHPEVGDTLLYTIQTRNTIEDSVVKKLAISDVVPEGLEYVPGTLQVDGASVSDALDDDKGQYTDGKVSGQIGDVTDSEWHNVTFEAKVKPGQAGKDIINTASISGDNIDTPDTPNNEVKVYPRNPDLESKKTSTIKEKVEGNKYPDHPEVGDTLLYTIQTRNTEEDSEAKNLTISDAIPDGLEYVPGTLKVDGTAVSDAQDDDKGDMTDGKVSGQIGDVKDTEWHNVTFEVKVKAGQAGETIKNTATVSGSNIDTPDKPSNDTEIYPRKPDVESKKTASLQAKAEGNKDEKHPEVGDTLLYTIETRNTIEDSLLKDLVISDELPDGLEYVSGSLKVDNKEASDAKDDDKGDMTDGKVSGQIGDVTDTEWHTVTFEAKVKAGQAGETIQNMAIVTGSNLDTPDTPKNEVEVYPRNPVLESKKTASIQAKAEGNKDENQTQVGDTLLYTIQTRNTVEDSLVKNLVISDELPEGLEYVSGTLKVDNKAVSDAQDDDKGDMTDGKVSGQIGNVTDTEWHTFTFEAKVKAGQADEKIVNTASVSGDNVDKPDKPSHEVKVSPRNPVLESEKTAKNLDSDKEKYEAGDTVVYTIKTRNTVKDSKVTDLVIADKLPVGLEYVSGTLKVDNKAVSDARDDDKGDVTEGKVSGQFGDVSDTEWHTVTFEAKIKAGQAGRNIVNTASVSGDNTDKPDTPSQEVKVSPKDPILKSEKSVKNLDSDKGKYEAGDTVVYTIKTKNTIADSKVTDLVISDELPDGLKYIEGSLKVSHEGKGSFENGKVSADFGDVTDTEWHTVTFQAKIESGYAEKTIKNVATVDGGNIDTPDKPGTDIKVDAKDPKLESKKTASIKEKADGNKDADHPESGDTLLYTIQTRNTIEDSLVKNLVISDSLPEGLEYVSGTLKVDGTAVSDDQDDDHGYYADGKTSGEFGNVTDTKWHSVTFEAKVKSGQAGKDIVNTANISSDNITNPDKPSHEVKVYPRNPVLESEKTAKNLDTDKKKYEAGDTVVYTIKTRNTVSDGKVENLVISDELPAGLKYVEGSLKASNGGKATIKDGKVTANFGDVTDTEWRTVTFQTKIESGYSGKTITNVATVEGSGIDKPDKPKVDITVEQKDPPVSDKSEEPVEPSKPNNPNKDQGTESGNELPNTATNTHNLILVGLVLLVAGTAFWYFRRKRNA